MIEDIPYKPMTIDLSSTAASFAPYGRAQVVSAIGGLHLLPENAAALLRLELLAHAAVTLPSTQEGPSITGTRLATLCNAPNTAAATLDAAQDPPEQPFIETVLFIGGSYRVLPGLSDEIKFTLEALLRALDVGAHADPRLLPVVRAVLAALIVSDAMCERSGLPRLSVTPTRLAKHVTVPMRARLKELQAAVTFDAAALNTLLNNRELSLADLSPFIIDQGTAPLTLELENGLLLFHPIVRFSSSFIVALPAAIAEAARRLILRVWHSRPDLLRSAEAYCDAVWSAVHHSLGFLRQSLLQERPRYSIGLPSTRQALYSFDTDKVLHVSLLTDPMWGYDPSNPFDQWPVGTTMRALLVDLASAERQLLTTQRAPNEILFLVLVQRAARMVLAKTPGRLPLGSLLLPFSAADLRTISLIEHDRMWLWRYAQAEAALHARMRVTSVNRLDLVDLFRTHRQTFYLSDDRAPDVMFVSPCEGTAATRLTAARERDIHSIVAPDGRHLSEVTCLYDSTEVPLYVPFDLQSARRVEFVYEAEGRAIWCVGPFGRPATHNPFGPIYKEAVEAAAYWIWQSAAYLSSVLPQLCDTRPIVVRVLLWPEAMWNTTAAVLDITAAGSLSVLWRDQRNECIILIHPAYATQMSGPDNRGDRLFLRAILSGLLGLRRGTLDEHAARVCDDIVASVAPVGLKQKWFCVPTGMDELDQVGLPAYRGLSDYDHGRLLDDIGAFLREKQGLTTGPIALAEHGAVLQDVVTFAFRRLEHLIRSLRPDGVLEWLVAAGEAILSRQAWHRVTYSTRSACFGGQERLLSDIVREGPTYARDAVACRFLIEFTAAQPPWGTRPMSYAVFDEALALAHVVASYRYMSDLLYFGLSDIDMQMLPSGRLGASQATFDDARRSHYSSLAAEELAQSDQAFTALWGTVSPGAPSRMDAIDAACKAEFGETLQDLAQFLGVCGGSARIASQRAACVAREELVADAQRELHWSPERVERALTLFVLGPREEFLRPSAPYVAADTYPWKFNRGLSYLRRPLLLRAAHGRLEIVWGFRQCSHCLRYLTGLIVSGRLNGHTAAMKTLMGRTSHEIGERFTDEVADRLESPGHIVKRRVRKIGRLRIGGPDLDLGDIDVLVASYKRRELVSVECKDLALARTPRELKRELVALFDGDDSHPSDVERHKRREEWLRGNLPAALTHMGISDQRRWRVRSLLVTDQPVLGAYLRRTRFPVLSIDELTRSDLAS